jgi:His/Glu/Gln/Arg/opine family amino acid ABC transporter permease subunit
MPAWVPAVARNLAVGLELTLLMSLVTAAASTVLGLVLGSASTLRSRAVTVPIRAYVELWRGLPIILTLFFIFFTLPAVGLRLEALYAALIGLTLWTSANCAEIVRGAVRSIPQEQHLAAAALGLSRPLAMVHVIMPQAVRRMLPPYVSLLANLVQSTALAAIVGVLELTQSAERQVARLTLLGSPHAPEILGAVMVLYFLICLPLTRASVYAERQLIV